MRQGSRAAGFSSLPFVSRWTGSVRNRLMLWNVCIVTLLLALAGGVVQFMSQRVLLATVEKDLKRRAEDFQERSQRMLLKEQHRDGEWPDGPGGFGGPGGPRSGFGDGHRGPPPNDHGKGMHSESPYVMPRVIGMDGVPLAPYSRERPYDPAAVTRGLRNEQATTVVTIGGEPVMVLTAPVLWRSQVIGIVQTAHSLTDTQRAIDVIKQTLLMLIPLGLASAWIGGAAVTRSALRPVALIARTAEGIDAHALSRRLEVHGSDELSQLAATINGMLDRLEQGFVTQRSLVAQLEALLERQKRFTADASHELKTPLAAAKLHSALLMGPRPTDAEYRESVEYIEDALNRMNRLVQDLLLLAQNDTGRPVRAHCATSLRSVVEQAVSLLPSTAEMPEVGTDGVPADLMVYGSEDDLVRVFVNLLSNATRHTPPNGAVRVEALGSAPGGENCVTVRVTDTGEGIAPEHLVHLGERFYRVDSARNRARGGFGLGLSICRSLLEQNRGTIGFESAPGQGTTVTVVLPAAG